jgi:hypothetical protein
MATDQDNGKQKKTLRDNITFIKPKLSQQREEHIIEIIVPTGNDIYQKLIW